MSDALRHAVKRTLAELAPALHGTRRLGVRTCCACAAKSAARHVLSMSDFRYGEVAQSSLHFYTLNSTPLKLQARSWMKDEAWIR